MSIVIILKSSYRLTAPARPRQLSGDLLGYLIFASRGGLFQSTLRYSYGPIRQTLQSCNQFICFRCSRRSRRTHSYPTTDQNDKIKKREAIGRQCPPDYTRNTSRKAEKKWLVRHFNRRKTSRYTFSFGLKSAYSDVLSLRTMRGSVFREE